MVKSLPARAGDSGSIRGLGRSPKVGNVFLLGISHGQRSLEGYSSWGCKKLGMTGKPGTPSRIRRGIDSPVVMRRGEGAQMKGCQDPRCSPRGKPACLGNFGGRMKGVRYRFATQDGT